ncbi:MAG: RNA methyltransferase [Deltaproteobacteria bacterium]|nr:RNA methyltransferase [Deltaproteobacteria bacterium]
MSLEHITIVLHKPHYPENIGAAARAAMNMGIHCLRVVAPENWDLGRALKLSTHVAADLIKNLETYDTLSEALRPFTYIVGTTSRIGRKRPVTSTPRATAARLVEIAPENRIALLFGPEDRGLSNDDLKFCHEVVLVPTADFHSLNVAQAVLILAYECFLAFNEKSPKPEPKRKPLATAADLERMYARLEHTLARIDFIDPRNPEYWMQKLRRSLGRFPLTRQDADLILGLCRQIDWAQEAKQNISNNNELL